MCGAGIELDQAFCESCGSPLGAGPVPQADAGLTVVEQDAPIELTRPTSTSAPAAGETLVPAARCLSCGSEVGADGYCTVCGTKAPIPRDHYVEQPASWVAAVCDRGVKHHRNEDATAIAADAEPGSRAVLVVCDGVSTSTDSDIASLAAARRARDVLVALQPAGLPNPASRSGAIAAAIESAVAQANEAVLTATPEGGPNAAACTFAAAVCLECDLVVYGNVGRQPGLLAARPGRGPGWAPSRPSSAWTTRWPRPGSPWASTGWTAENGPQAHAITKWLGRDSPDIVPRTGSVLLGHPGWVLVCSDGLWNYCSEAGPLGELVARLAHETASPLELGEALVRWANEQGGRDNVSVALARH